MLKTFLLRHPPAPRNIKINFNKLPKLLVYGNTMALSVKRSSFNPGSRETQDKRVLALISPSCENHELSNTVLENKLLSTLKIDPIPRVVRSKIQLERQLTLVRQNNPHLHCKLPRPLTRQSPFRILLPTLRTFGRNLKFGLLLIR